MVKTKKKNYFDYSHGLSLSLFPKQLYYVLEAHSRISRYHVRNFNRFPNYRCILFRFCTSFFRFLIISYLLSFLLCYSNIFFVLWVYSTYADSPYHLVFVYVLQMYCFVNDFGFYWWPAAEFNFLLFFFFWVVDNEGFLHFCLFLSLVL